MIMFDHDKEWSPRIQNSIQMSNLGWKNKNFRWWCWSQCGTHQTEALISAGAWLPPGPAILFPPQGKDESPLTNQICTPGAHKVSAEESGNILKYGSGVVAFFFCAFSFQFFDLPSLPVHLAHWVHLLPV